MYEVLEKRTYPFKEFSQIRVQEFQHMWLTQTHHRWISTMTRCMIKYFAFFSQVFNINTILYEMAFSCRTVRWNVRTQLYKRDFQSEHCAFFLSGRRCRQLMFVKIEYEIIGKGNQIWNLFPNRIRIDWPITKSINGMIFREWNSK
jgi:hypothetical protein